MLWVSEHNDHEVAPHLGKIAVIATNTSSARADLSAAGNLGSAVNGGVMVTLVADGQDTYIFFNTSDAGTVDETQASGNDRAFLIPADTSIRVFIRAGYTWLVHKAPGGAGFIRAYISGVASKD